MKKLLEVLTPARSFAWITGAISGIVFNLVSNRMEGWGGWLLPTLALTLLASLLAQLFFETRPKRVRVKVEISPPFPIRTNREALGQARKGLIGFVPLYRRIRGRQTLIDPAIEGENNRELARNLDYSGLDLENSNLEPIIKAILTHQSKLRHCWLIATGGQRGSHLYIPVLLKYLQEVKGIHNVSFHVGEEYQVLLEEDETVVVEKTRQMVEGIFNHARQIWEMADNDLIADITSGPRSLPLGMTLACLDEGRDLEFVGTHYDDLSNPQGLFPIMFHFRTKVTEEK